MAGGKEQKETTIAQLAKNVQMQKLPDAEKPLIVMDHVSKSFKVGKNTIPVLKNISLRVFPGEFIIILGPSGSGKSTLLNVLLGLEMPSSGRVLLNNVDITKKKADQISKIRFKVFGIIFQKSDWIRSINVVQNVALPLAMNNVGRQERLSKAIQRLTEVGMVDHAQYEPTELSGGQQQKVSLARALVNDPPIIVADEPTGNLDTVSAEKVMNTFKDLNEKFQKTIMMVTHNIDYVRYASRTIYVRDGTIIDGGEQFKS